MKVKFNAANHTMKVPLFAFIAAMIVFNTVGCQTCSLSQEDFEKQQRGQTVDRETGETVAVVGTLGYYGAIIGEMLAAIFR